MTLGTIRARRSYQAWVANETIEDYSLRYAARSFRKWSPFVIANTALGGISFLALEAIGGAITISYGFSNAFLAIVLVCTLIFITNLPIAYYSSKHNIDMDLLTRGAGFGYIGSTITSRAGELPRSSGQALGSPARPALARVRTTWPDTAAMAGSMRSTALSAIAPKTRSGGSGKPRTYSATAAMAAGL